MKERDIKHLEWVYERMKYVHNENENYDYMIRFREILEVLRQSAVISSLPSECQNGWENSDYCMERGKCKKCL